MTNSCGLVLDFKSDEPLVQQPMTISLLKAVYEQAALVSKEASLAGEADLQFRAVQASLLADRALAWLSSRGLSGARNIGPWGPLPPLMSWQRTVKGAPVTVGDPERPKKIAPTKSRHNFRVHKIHLGRLVEGDAIFEPTRVSWLGGAGEIRTVSIEDIMDWESR